MKGADIIPRAIKEFGTKRILVIGDLLLDVYLNGRSRRLCPEAPVPVVDVESRTVFPGGAANTVCNLRALGATVDFCTVIGKDAEGVEAIEMLREIGIEERNIIRCRGRKTITKTRVVAGSQVITRLDQGTDTEIDETTERMLMRIIEHAYKKCDAVIISDYEKGILTSGVLQGISDLRKRQDKFLAVDSKRLPFFAELKPSYAKPNYEEALKVLNVSPERDRARQIASCAKTLYHMIQAPLISVTLDGDGSVLIDSGAVTHSLNAQYVGQPHVAGAGDTYISAFVLSWLTSKDTFTCGQIATAAATVAIRKERTSTCTQHELRRYFNLDTKYITGTTELAQLCKEYRDAGKRIVFTNGCFDILHSGHVAYLQRARQLGDVLIVGLNTDESIKRIKGKDRPINSLSDRIQVLSGLSSVDHIIAFGDEQDDTPIPLIRIVRPGVFAKGGDYSKEKLPEAATVERCGGTIAIIEQVPDHSTTRIISRITGTRKAGTQVSGFER